MAAEENKQGYAGMSWVKSLGYPQACIPIESEVRVWWNWYRARGSFYRDTDTSTDGKGVFKTERLSFNPARMVCEDWAGLLFNYRTEVGLKETAKLTNTDNVVNWIQQWVDSVSLLTDATAYERCFGLGTYAFVLGYDNLREDGIASEDTKVSLGRYDALSIVPLTWDEHKCTEAAFVSTIVQAGKTYTQWVVHTLDDEGCAVIQTAHFTSNGSPIALNGFTSKVETHVKGPLFVLISPAIDNTYDNHGPFGVSVFDKAIGAVKLSDGAFDNTWKDIFLGQKLLFIPEEILATDKDGNYVIPRAKDQQLFMAVPESGLGGSSSTGINEYNPDLRVDQNRQAISTALQLLGKRCGFGSRYYSLDDSGNPKTAKEVASDNADLMRNAKRHEQRIGDELVHLIERAAAMATRQCNANLPELDGCVQIIFGDTIIQDEDTERERMRADVSAGLVPAWKYLETFYGLDRASANEWLADVESETSTTEDGLEI